MFWGSFLLIAQAVGQDCQAELYQHGGFKGWKATYRVGDYDFAAFKGKGAKNDDASSIKVIGKDCEAIVYQHGDFSGWQAVFKTGDHDFPEFTKQAKNDHASAIK